MIKWKTNRRVIFFGKRFQQIYKRCKMDRGTAYEGVEWEKLQAHECKEQLTPAERALQNLESIRTQMA